MNEQTSYAPRPILLPAVLQIAGCAPYFGMIASVSDQGLAFDFQEHAPAEQAVGSKVRLDFDFQSQHYSCHCLLVHVRGGRALLSLREAPTALLSTLHSVNRHNTPPLGGGLLILQKQQACHAQFMDSMNAMVGHFYRMLSEKVDESQTQSLPQNALSALTDLQHRLTQLKPIVSRQFTQTYPMYPEQRASHSGKRTSGEALTLIDMDQVDDWIRRSGIAHQIAESLSPLPEVFSRHYAHLLKQDQQRLQSPYSPEAVLNILADMIAPLKLGVDERTLCYELMGKALQEIAVPLYQSLLQIIGEAPPEFHSTPGDTPDLAQWLKETARQTNSAENSNISGIAATTDQLSNLTELVFKLTENLGELSERQRYMVPAGDLSSSAQALIPGLLARDRILGRFTSGMSPAKVDANAPQLQPDWMSAEKFGARLGGLSSFDSTELENLYAQLMQPPPIDPGPETLAQASQVRSLMLQAQGLLLEYTLNGLTYQAQPDHPAWTLINALDALHRGADDRGKFLDPVVNQATSLAMQWLLGQQDTLSALKQVNALLAKLNAQIFLDQQSRRKHHLDTLGETELDPAPINSSWCVVKCDDGIIPHELLGKYDGNWALLNRSATQLLKIPEARFIDDLDEGLIEEADSYDSPFLQRIANTTLTSSLNAVHAFTWQDPGSGCLKRAALLDELERRLLRPVSDPSTYCALVEIPTMRPSLSSLPRDELVVAQKRTGEILLNMLQNGEHCGRLSDVSFLLVFSPQAPDQLEQRLSQLKSDMESLHPEWKMIGAVVPLIDNAEKALPTPSSVLRRANQACTSIRQQADFDLSCLRLATAPGNPYKQLPYDSLFLRCQKIAACDEGAPSHYEILLGVKDDLVPSHTTQSFVVMAEQTGHIHDLDIWVLQSVLDWMEHHSDELDRLSGISVNLSGNSLVSVEHVDEMVSLLAGHPHLTNKLIIEVTETAAIGNLEMAVRSLRKLRNLGCRVALDDFGSGYSSYGYLRTLPLDYLKIDGIYIRNILTDKTDQALTASMVDVAHALGLKVIAEFVDSEAAYNWLKDLGVDYVQGYWVHEPERLDTLIHH